METEGSAGAAGSLEEKEAHAATTIFLAALFSLDDAAPTPMFLSFFLSNALCNATLRVDKDQKRNELRIYGYEGRQLVFM